MRNFILFVLIFQLATAFIRGGWLIGFMLGTLIVRLFIAAWRGGVWLLGLVRRQPQPSKNIPHPPGADSVRPLRNDRPL